MLEIYRKIMYILFFLKGRNYFLKTNFIDSLKYFTQAEKYYAEDYQLYIYKGLNEFFIKLFDNALISFQKALGMIDSSQKLNLDEKKYLKKYIIEYILISSTVVESFSNYDKYKNIYYNLEYKKDNINKNLLLDFPITDNNNPSKPT